MEKALSLIHKFYPDDTDLRQLLLLHSRQVMEKALTVCEKHPELSLDRTLVLEGAMLHDIGIFLCDAPGIHCHGPHHYLLHGTLGGQLLRAENMPQLAQFCERHTGTGLQAEQFQRLNIPIPELLRNDKSQMALTPQTLEEKVVCYADKFFSKSHPERERTVTQTAESLRKFGETCVDTFLHWATLFE
ncbi:MAG: HD domain-containing protein [Alloprevotella sp.]|nr:HD domain-containing protein [Alloprevotella sp.]